MPTPLSVVQDELRVFVAQEIEKTKPSLAAHLPHPGLAELAGVYAVDTEKFWKQKQVDYFFNQTKSKNESFETSFQTKLELLEVSVAQDGMTLMHFGTEAKNNPEIVKLAVVQDERALEYASVRIQKNPSLLSGDSNSSSASSGLTGNGFFQQSSNNSNTPEEKDDDNSDSCNIS